MPTHFNYLSTELEEELRKIANTMATRGKGILAADEPNWLMGSKFAAIGVDNTEQNRRLYRQLIFSCDSRLEECISGIILFEETLTQKTNDGRPFLHLLRSKGILPGVKVDCDPVLLPGNSEGEVTTQGLDDLDKRCARYKKLGCQFVKWRCCFRIGRTTPSYQAIIENANVTARYASIAQANGLVPIVEPEVLCEGDHDLDRCQKVTETVLSFVYKALNDHHVFLEGTILKPNMVTPGQSCLKKCTPEQIALVTVTTFQRTVPTAVPGIAFLSGGQSEVEASVNLNAINALAGKKPWALTFSFGRALQASALKAWGGRADQVKDGQEEFLKRAKANSLASLRKYEAGSIKSMAAGDKMFLPVQ